MDIHSYIYIYIYWPLIHASTCFRPPKRVKRMYLKMMNEQGWKRIEKMAPEIAATILSVLSRFLRSLVRGPWCLGGLRCSFEGLGIGCHEVATNKGATRRLSKMTTASPTCLREGWEGWEADSEYSYTWSSPPHGVPNLPSLMLSDSAFNPRCPYVLRAAAAFTGTASSKTPQISSVLDPLAKPKESCGESTCAV